MKFVIVLFAALYAVCPVSAGAISGVVYDATGGVIPGAVVTVVNLGTKAQEFFTTDQTGRYSFNSVPDGRYTIEVNKAGFAMFQRKDLVSKSSGPRKLDVVLRLGSVNETVDVVGDHTGAAKANPAQQVRAGGSGQPPKLVHMVRPAYPPQLKELGIEGPVLLHAVIGADGGVSSLSVTNTPADPELGQAAVEAVQQWRYEPALLDGKPVSVTTEITVNFTLAR